MQQQAEKAKTNTARDDAIPGRAGLVGTGNGVPAEYTAICDDAITSRILTVRGVQVLLGFMFQLSHDEMENWKSQFVTSNLSADFSRIIDLFAGIGGIRLGVQAVGGKCIKEAA